ncbi:UTP-glucose-1-phosphate uridylyltransferase [Micractinium conductrix]|uniref:UTP-glucose-1-phosphate uridylyltransferase n=1 Tax=Micractinium conductrix TaxID=554055 RepID=A0A2P6V4J3_9CHLO|nr:UTP-glucose-1-phosphate uridylyltransferase [Micractinium conductrix]|eukprot:PSC69010.1 UTP-glucose-1-phosphate uridylyltransferase [Micractinium conductrix]
MSQPGRAGYEPLLDEQGGAASSRGQQQQQPAAAAAAAAAPASAAPAPAAPAHAVLGIPAYPQQQTVGRPAAIGSFPPYLEELPPSAAEEWERAAVLMSLWLGCAAATLALTTLTGNVLGMIGSLCATLAAATHRCKCCRPAMVGDDLGALVQRVFSLAVAAATLCGIVATLTLLIAFGLSAACAAEHGEIEREHCAEMTEATLFYGLWLAAFTALTVAVLRRASRMRRLLNPVTNGVVNI